MTREEAKAKFQAEMDSYNESGLLVQTVVKALFPVLIDMIWDELERREKS